MIDFDHDEGDQKGSEGNQDSGGSMEADSAHAVPTVY